MTIGVISIIVSLILLMYLAYRGFSVIVVAPILSLCAVSVAALALGQSPEVMAHYTELFMLNAGNYVRNFFPIFLLGAVFGKLLEASGSADSISEYVTSKLGAKNAILAVVLSCAILTYGGVSLFVVSFAIYPIGAKLFREAGINKRLLPGAIALGAFTFTMTALPGSPQIQNAIPMKYLGTDAYAAPILGLVASAIMFGGGMLWLISRAKFFSKKYPGYGEWKEDLIQFDEEHLKNMPSVIVAALPILVCLITNYVLSKHVFPNQNLEYLEKYKTTAKAVIGNWSLILALLLAIVVTIILNHKRMKDIVGTVNSGVSGSFLAIFNTASETGYGNIIASMAAFTVIASAITSISSNTLVTAGISTSVLAGFTGSASGGLSIALNTMGDQLLQSATAAGIRPEVLHRVASVACGGMDTLPHNGAVITLLAITQMKHRDSYLDIGMNTVIIPLIALAVIIILGSMGIA